MDTDARFARAATCAAVALLFATTAFAQAADKNQQKCINAMNKDGAKLAAKQGKENVSCLKNAGKGKLPGGQSADECLVADAKGKIAKAEGKTEADFSRKCADELPTFGLPAGTAGIYTGTVAASVNGAAVDGSLSLLADVFGASLTNAVIDCGTDKDGCKCQQAVAKDYEKLAATKFKEFLKCKKSVLKDGADSSSDLQACVDDAGTTGSVADDAKGKIGKKRDKLGSDIAKKCTGVSTARAFPGRCASLVGNALRDCIDARVECRVCLTINAMDGLAVDCDTFDDGALNGSCPSETFDLRSPAEPADTPGSSGVAVTNAKLIAQFGGADFSLNNARFTRFRLNAFEPRPDAILVLVPGFEGGANDFKILAENLISRFQRDYGMVLEVWGYDRRSNQLEDTVGLDIAEAQLDPLIGLDWLFGAELGLALHPALAAGPNRRAEFYDTHADVPFIANWTGLVFSRDIDAIVQKAQSLAKNGNVFLGGHSAGTGFTARYAATDFNLTAVGSPDPGYARLRGLVLLEGGGGSTGGAPLTSDTLDRIEAKFDGGLFGAVRDNAGRCVDGSTACTIATEATACAGQVPPKCTLTTTSYSVVAGLLNPRILASVEPSAIQGMTDPDSGQIILRADQGSAGNNAVAKVPDLGTLALLPQSTVEGGIGSFVDDDGVVAAVAPFVATSVGAPGPVVGGLLTWLDITEGPLPLSVLPDNGPAPTSLPAGKWGQEKEVTRFDRLLPIFFAGRSNFTDWYYPSSGLGITSVSGVCSGVAGTCTVGDVGAACSGGTKAEADAQCTQSISLDSTALSVGRNRRDIENLTQAAQIDIPVISFGGTNGLATVPASFLPFAESIGTCTAPSCDGTPRVVDDSNPNPAFPTFGDVNGGFEVYMNEGFAHLDVVTAEDNAANNVLAPLAAFLARNLQ